MTDTQQPFAVVASQGWFDGEIHRPERMTWVVQGGRVAGMAAGEQGAQLLARHPGLPVHEGGFVMPGLVDAHVHLFLDGAPTDNKVRAEHLKQPLDQLVEAARRSARQALACGVTLVRDAGDRHGINNRIREEARQALGSAGAARLPRVRSGGLGIKRPKRYGAFMATDVEDAQAIRESVARLAPANDEIKLILTGIIDFDAGAVTDEPQFSLEDARLVVQTARDCGRQVFAHCSGLKGLEIAARAAVGSIEHGFFMNRDILGLMRDHEVAWTPTFCPVHFQWAHPEAVGWSAQTVGHLRRILDDHARHLVMAHEMGVTLLLGTDAGSMGVEHGHAVFDEIDRFAEAGLPLQAILHAASTAPRRHFARMASLEQARSEGLTLAAGAPFDAVLLASSPFVDRAALRQPLATWVL